MALNLVDYEHKTREAVMAFWGNREAAAKKQVEAGKADQGERKNVTAGKNMDGFLALVMEIVRGNGLEGAEMHRQRPWWTLPGYFRPTKSWDLLVVYRGELVAAIELKSHIGPSFGNNFNNRAEEAIGTAHDFWTAYREDLFGKQPRPFVGWLMLVEACPKSYAPIRDRSPHFPVLAEFQSAPCVVRYDLLCQKLVKEQLYTTATLLVSAREAIQTGEYSTVSGMTDLTTFVTSLAGHAAAHAARIG
jgi:hypothetical protein